MRRLLGTRWVVAGIAVSLLVLASCGGGGSTDRGGDDTGGEPSGPFDESGVLRVAYNTGPDSLDPLKQTSDPTALSLKLVYDRLIHAEPDTTLVPGLGETWEWTDDLTLEMTLRQDVTFHDGEPFDAAAVQANLERTMAYDEGVTLATTGVVPLEAVEVVDDHTVRFTLSTPTPDFLVALAEYAGMMISPAAIESENLDLNAVGAGMFTLASFRPGDRISVTRYDGYWDPDAVRLGGVEVSQIADADTRFNALRSGQLDMTFLEPRQVSEAESAGFTIDIADSLAVYALITNSTAAPMDDVVVRRALSQSIDRVALVDELFLGMAEPTLQLFPSTYPAYNPDHGLDSLPYDPAAARQSLEDAGYDGDVTVDVLVLNRPQDQQLFEVMQQMAAEGGITLRATAAEPAQFGEYFTEGGPVQVFLGRLAGRINPVRSFAATMGVGPLNPGSGSTEEMTAFIDELLGTDLDDPGLPDRLRAASAEGVESMLEVPLAVVQVPWAESECVQDFRPYLTISDEFRGVSLRTGCQ